MDRYVSRDLQNMLCRELEGIAKRKEIDTPATVDILKGLTGSLKNLMKIEEMEMEKQDPMKMGTYSQRSRGNYYIDGIYGDYEPWDEYSYAQGGRGGNSNARGGNSNARGGNSNRGGNSYMYDMGNSYMYPMYARGGYSRQGDEQEEIKQELQKLMSNTSDEQIKKSISEMINKMD